MVYSKCDKTSFEIKENIPAFSNYKILFVQRGSCGTMIGAMD